METSGFQPAQPEQPSTFVPGPGLAPEEEQAPAGGWNYSYVAEPGADAPPAEAVVAQPEAELLISSPEPEYLTAALPAEPEYLAAAAPAAEYVPETLAATVPPPAAEAFPAATVPPPAAEAFPAAFPTQVTPEPRTDS